MVDAIVALEVTYGHSSLASVRFHRVVDKDHQGANINAGGSAMPVYLWYLTGVSDAPIVDITVLHDAEEAPEGYTRLKEDLNKHKGAAAGEHPQARIAYRKAAPTADMPAIGDIRIAFGGDSSPLEDGFEALPHPLTIGDGDGAVLWVKKVEYTEESAAPPFSVETIAVGDQCDCKDTVDKWRVAQILEVHEDKIRVHYKGWPSRWDEDIPAAEFDRLVRLHTHTVKGQDTGTARFRQGDVWDCEAKELENMEDRITSLMDGSMDEEEKRAFLSVELPLFAEKAMTSSVPEVPIQIRLNQFYEVCHRLNAWYFQKAGNVPDVVVTLFLRLFLADTQCDYFFNNYGACKHGSERAALTNGRYSRIPASGASYFFVGNMNVFGEAGGYEALLERCQREGEDEIEIGEVEKIIHGLYQCRFCYEESFGDQYFPQIHEAVFKRLTRLTDEQLKEMDSNSVRLTVRRMVQLDFEATTRPETSRQISKLQLDLGLRLIRCETLNDRLYGATLINDVVNLARPTPERGAAEEEGDIPVGSLPLDFVSEWVDGNRVVDILLGAEVDGKSVEPHVEVLKRVPVLLRCLARANKVTSEHLNLLWGATVGASDMQRRAVYKIVSKLARSLPPEFLDIVYERMISRIPRDQLDAVAFELIRDFTDFGLKTMARAEQERWYGLELLWELMQDGTDAEVANQAQASLMTLLKKKHCERHAQRIVRRCVEKLGTGGSVAQCLQLAHEIISDMPTAKYAADGQVSRDQMLNYLEKHFKVVNAVLADIARYKAAALSAGVDEGGGSVVVGRFTHDTHVERRLDFLLMHLNESSTELHYDQIKALWELLAVDPIVPEDKEQLLRWLYRARYSDVRADAAEVAFPPEVCERVFAELLCSPEAMSYASLGPKGYNCFELFFRLENERQGRLENATSGSHFSVVDIRLQGLESLWEIGLTSKTASIVRQALQFLVALHTRVSLSMDVKAIWGNFVNECMSRVSAAQDAMRSGSRPADAAESEIEAVMHVLREFLSDIEDAGKRVSVIQPFMLHVLVRDLATGEETQYQTPVEGTTTVKNMRDKVAATVQRPSELIRLVHHPTKTVLDAESWDSHTLIECHIKTMLIAEVLTEPAPDTQSSRTRSDSVEWEDARVFARKTLTNDQAHFDLLFDLLALKSDNIVADSWALLDSLPVNSRVQRDLRTLCGAISDDASGADGGAVAWSTILDGRELPRLLYALQIVRMFVQPKSEQSERRAAIQATWCEKFITLGGYKHLMDVVLSTKTEDFFAGRLSLQCLALVLRLLNFFATTPSHADSVRSIGVFEDPKAVSSFVTQLLRVFARAVKMPSEPVRAELSDKHGGRARAASAGSDKAEPTPLSAAGEIIKFALSCVAAFSARQPAGFEAVVAFSSSEPALVDGVLRCGDVSSRDEAHAGLYKLCTEAARAARGADSEDAEASAPGDGAGASPLSEHVLTLMLNELPTLQAHADRCTQFVALVRKLLRGVPRATAPDARASFEHISIDAPALAIRLAQMITAHSILENNDEDEDHVLRGLMQVMLSLVHGRPALKTVVGEDAKARGERNIVDTLFDDCLFAIPSPDLRKLTTPPKCKNPTSRRYAFLLLAELARECPSNHARLCAMSMAHHLKPLKKKKEKRSVWDFLTRDDTKSSTGYVGLKNLGCICYMNSSMQQFFMVPEFRRGMLKFEDDEDDKSESMMYQMQRIFAYLQESEKQYFNPKGFCHAFKDWGGDPTDVLVQKDASEFLGMLFQQIENRTMGSEQEKLLKNVFGGTLSSELIADGHYSEREDPFQFISVNVKNRTSLDEALREFISGEQVDYKWEEPDGTKVELPTMKRSSFKELPPHLIIHLKRFEFDYETLRQVKLNDRFEFARELNLKPYTREGRPDKVSPDVARARGEDAAADGGDDEEGEGGATGATEGGLPDEHYQYELMGVVVHTGTADTGHYYSFIRERRPAGTAPPADGSDERRWLCFNDNIVTEWNDAEMERECFGGEETYRVPASASGAREYTQTATRHRNGFVLFYDRVYRPDAGDATGGATESKSSAGEGKASEAKPRGSGAAATASGGGRRERTESVDVQRNRWREAQLAHSSEVPPEIFGAVWNENVAYWQHKNVFDKAYFDFVHQLLKSAEGDDVGYPTKPITNEADAIAAGGPTMTVARLGFYFVVNTLSQSKDQRKSLPEWTQAIGDLLAHNKVACIWLIQSFVADVDRLRLFLLESTEDATRRATAELLKAAVKGLRDDECTRYPTGVLNVVKRPEVGGVGESKDPAGSDDSDGDDGAQVAPAPAGASTPFVAPHNQSVAALVETLLALLPDVAVNMSRFAQYCELVGDIAHCGAEERVMLVRQGAIARLVHLLLGKESPHPELSGDVDPTAALTAAAKAADLSDPDSDDEPVIGPRLPGSRVERTKSSAYALRPSYYPFFRALNELVFTCSPPSGAATSPFRDYVVLAGLTELDLEMVLCKPFLLRMLTELAQTDYLPVMRPVLLRLVTHLSWENEDVSKAIATLIADAAEREDHHNLKPLFRAVSLVFRIEDSLRPQRVNMLMAMLTAVMKENARYFRATEVAIAQTVMLCRRHDIVMEWVRMNGEAVAWMGPWLRTHESAPDPDAEEAAGAEEAEVMQLLKPGYGTNPSLGVSRSPQLSHNVELVIAGKEPEDDGYDSETDPQALVGKRVSVRWASNKWYEGFVSRYSQVANQHIVVYDDNERKPYYMSDKVFRIVGDEAELRAAAAARGYTGDGRGGDSDAEEARDNESDPAGGASSSDGVVAADSDDDRPAYSGEDMTVDD